jgi:hypothetical protein
MNVRNPSSRIDETFAAPVSKPNDFLSQVVGQVISGLQASGAILGLSLIQNESLENSGFILIPSVIIATLLVFKGRSSMVLGNVGIVVEMVTMLFWMRVGGELSEGALETTEGVVGLGNVLVIYASILWERAE